MKKVKIKRNVVVMLVVALTLVGIMSGCVNSKSSVNNTETNTSESKNESTVPNEAKKEEPQTIKLYYTFAQTGPITGWLGDYLLEQGLKVENIPTDDAKLQAMIVSGDLPDVVFTNTDRINELINANLLLNLDDHLGKLPNVVQNASTALDYMRTHRSNGSGKLYGVPFNVGDYKMNVDTGVYAINVRWDIYKAIGAPKAKTLEDLIPILKAMQEKYPKTETGEKTYALNMFSSNDKGVRLYNMSTLLTVLGYHESANQNCINYNIKKNVVTSLLDDNEVYLRGLKFFYQLNKNGLLEPDGVTQTKATSDAKIKTGAYIATGFAGYIGTYNTQERMDAGIGYRPIIFDEFIASTMGDYPVGAGSYFIISKNTKNINAHEESLKADLLSIPGIDSDLHPVITRTRDNYSVPVFSRIKDYCLSYNQADWIGLLSLSSDKAGGLAGLKELGAIREGNKCGIINISGADLIHMKATAQMTLKWLVMP